MQSAVEVGDVSLGGSCERKTACANYSQGYFFILIWVQCYTIYEHGTVDACAQMVVIAVHDMSLSFLLNIYSGDREYDDAMKMHLAKWYLAQMTRMPPNAMYAP